ncbi:hypothetical protein QT503_22600, partial [Xanthomonas citri pv. citri]
MAVLALVAWALARREELWPRAILVAGGCLGWWRVLALCAGAVPGWQLQPTLSLAGFQSSDHLLLRTLRFEPGEAPAHGINDIGLSGARVS